MKRKIYLNMHTRKEAQQLFWARFASCRTTIETIPAREACGRVTAGPVHARFSAPSFHAAAMDGLAVWAEETFSAFARRYDIETLRRTDPAEAGPDVGVRVAGHALRRGRIGVGAD